MNENRLHTNTRGRRNRRGMTLVEVLLVIAVLSLFMGIVVPSLYNARKTADVSVCLSNLREIVTAGIKYSEDQCTRRGANTPTLPWHLGHQYGTLSCDVVSEFVYGGFQTPYQSVPEPDAYPGADWHRYPTEIRPFTKYIAPGTTGRGIIKTYVCPADKSLATPMVGGDDTSVQTEARWASWEVFGNSYPINWYWYEDARYDQVREYSDLPCYSLRGSDMLRMKVGRSASRFVIFYESLMNSYMMEARPPDGSQGQSSIQELGIGWHGKFSRYSMAMWDGHAEHRFIDTRYTADAGYNTWPELRTPVQICN